MIKGIWRKTKNTFRSGFLACKVGNAMLNELCVAGACVSLVAVGSYHLFVSTDKAGNMLECTVQETGEACSADQMQSGQVQDLLRQRRGLR